MNWKFYSFAEHYKIKVDEILLDELEQKKQNTKK